MKTNYADINSKTILLRYTPDCIPFWHWKLYKFIDTDDTEAKHNNDLQDIFGHFDIDNFIKSW